MITRVLLAMPVALLLARPEPVAAQDELDALLQEGEPGEAQEDREGEPDDGKPTEPTREPAPPPQEEAQPTTEREPSGEPAASRSPTRRRAVEEIIVTAQKAEQDIRDVPISMSVLGSEFLRRQSITDLEELSLHVPNARISSGGTPAPSFSIRGFTTHPVNKAFEQAIGLVLDGVPYGTIPYFQLPLFDVERVEVLRGPQGTLFGKNSTAGLFNITTKQPTSEFTGSIQAKLGELDRRRIEAGIGGPLVEGLVNFRIAGLVDERDGILENTTGRTDPEANRRAGSHDRKALRFKVELPDVFGANLKFGYERHDTFVKGLGQELRLVQPNIQPLYRFWDPNVDFEEGNFVGSVDAPEFLSIEGDLFVGEVRYDLEGWEFDAVAGQSFLSLAELSDADFGPTPLLDFEAEDDHPQTTFELRVASPDLPGWFGVERLLGWDLGNTKFTTGFFWQRRLIDDSATSLIIDPVVAAQTAAFQSAPEQGVEPLSEFIGPAVEIADFGTFDTTQGKEISTVFFDQTTRSLAGFGQMEWHFLPRWTLQYGMRLSGERKEAAWESVIEQGTGALSAAALGREEFTQELSRSEFQFTPKVMLRHDLTETVDLYAGWVRGFRAGGFNNFVSQNEPRDLTFEEESVRSWELGSKLDLLGGAARLNVGAYWMNLVDFQVLRQNPDNAVFFVVNAGEARARGLEMDATWLPTDWLDLRGALSFNDTEFLDFPFGTCPAGGDEDVCDITGEPLDAAPKWTSTVTTNVSWPLGSIPGVANALPQIAGLDWTSGLTVEYRDTHFVDIAVRDPRVRQPSFVRLNGKIGFENVAQGWSLGLVGRNLTDEAVRAFSSDAVLADGQAFYQIVDPPRLVFGEFRLNF